MRPSFRVPRALWLTPLVLAPALALADWPLGSRLDGGLLVDITEEGFAGLQSLVGAFLPPRIDIPPFATAASSGCLFGACLYSYDIQGNNLFVEVAINTLALTPATGALNLDADATVTVNTPADPGSLYVAFELIYIDIIDETCDLWVDPINVEMNGAIQMALIPDPLGTDVDGDGSPDTKLMDVTVPPMTWSWDATGNDIQFTNCGLASVINDVNAVTGFFGFDLYDLLLDMVEPEIDTLINDLPAEIEPLLEDTFASLTISEELDLLGVPLTLNLWPETLTLQPDGMRVSMSSVLDVPMAPCVERYGLTESLATPGAPPGIGDVSGLSVAPHAGALIDDDWVNHLLFAAWAGGILCYEISSESSDIALPLPIDTSLLGLLAPGVFDALLPETAPMAIVTDPRMPPVVEPIGDHDINVAANGLGLGFFVDLDGRQARLLNIDLDIDAGIDLDFDTTTGNLGIGVDIGEGAITSTVTFNEFVPDSNEEIQASFGGLFDALVGPLLGGLLTDLSFAIPSFEGVGVLDMDVAPVGANQDFIGMFAEIGVVPYYSAGCDSSEGCDTSSCSSGCSTGSVPGRAILLLVPLVAVLRRRRSVRA